MVYPPYRDSAMRPGPLAVFVDLQEFRMRREQVNTIAHDASVKVDKHHHHFGLQGHLVARQMAAAARDAVVLDCRIPGEPSAQFALHAKSMRLPVVMISGHVGTMQFAAENGLQLLRKPFHMADLLNAVREAIASGEFGQRAA